VSQYKTVQEAEYAFLEDLKTHREHMKKVCDLYGKQMCEMMCCDFNALQNKIEVHDISKVNNPVERDGFLAKFYPSDDRPYKDHQVRVLYDRAKLDHYHANADHPEHWVYIDNNRLVAADMEPICIVEMILNWIVNSMVPGNMSVQKYWICNRDQKVFTENTIKQIDILVDWYIDNYEVDGE